MNISQETDYALRSLRAMYFHGPDSKMEAKAISEREKIPLRFLFKILRKLCASKIIVSYRGINGGYKLNKPLSDTTLKELIEIIEGPIHINRCTKDNKSCELCVRGCELYPEMLKVEQEIHSILEQRSLEDILLKRFKN
ncbi:RrF2 family transcriptional regulator [Clostridium massiliamazoniense]|uniref:RrF2 family transcriptional regulator n=1 Tax=Clostridium massiliamazoniense TaxID=1347366 RepID=UPI0006D78DFA|nr:Rrf2 family transcriptional regulator [Clostridium massiliamazoniense]